MDKLCPCEVLFNQTGKTEKNNQGGKYMQCGAKWAWTQNQSKNEIKYTMHNEKPSLAQFKWHVKRRVNEICIDGPT